MSGKMVMDSRMKCNDNLFFKSKDLTKHKYKCQIVNVLVIDAEDIFYILCVCWFFFQSNLQF